MRGRTNASNGGIFLNATTDDFEVATGNSIVAGDFVEYHYDTEVKPLNTTFRGDAYLVDATTHTYIALIGGYPTLFTYTNSEITIVSNYQTASNFLARLDDTHYVVCNDTTHKIGLVVCSTGEITLVSEKTTASSVIETFARVDSKTIAYKHVNSNSLYKVVADADYTNITVSSTNINATFDIAGATSSDVIICQTSGSSSSGYTNTFKLYNVETLTQSSTFSLGSSYTSMSLLPKIIIDDRYILTFNTVRVGSSSYSYYQVLFVIDTVDKRSVTNIRFDDYSSQTSLSVSAINGQNQFIVYERLNNLTYMYWVKYDDSLATLNKSDYTTTSYNGLIFTLDANNFALMIDNNGYVNLNTTAGKVLIGELTDTVQEWRGGINPMGVAKQSGNAGDTIAVYIPQVNN